MDTERAVKDDVMDYETAKEIAARFLGQPDASAGYSFVILDEHTIERPTCFVFFYESSRHLETDVFEDRLVGNAPVLVDRKSGEPVALGTGRTAGFYIDLFEAGKLGAEW
ncbi:hypothetical protein D0B54_18015 [Solimonas sp. K1W22B-7]|uniref:YrhB domain-containing protein n=1 Tax=Solimonas sp. K1W22B-7 TaxID=2303331 RepID=UPI000E3338F3|nr:YrhB domain-containing protein [Solimonas sp. K1W22B-7]AXQ30456.1 hypothetical protein D0B54_18015 [Solimonas sp. K1W22B-7]